jgi:hypothetical protein
VCVLLLPAVAYAIYCSARVAMAESFFRAGTPDSVAMAVRMEEGNAAWHRLRAEQMESAGLDPTEERTLAARLSPLDSRGWIDLGVLAEVHADFGAAEKYYLRAASVDRTFAPRWALMNFYFRRHEDAQFRRWTREALPMIYDDPSPVFRLCWLMAEDSDSIRTLLPGNNLLWRQYLTFLMDEGHWEAVAPVARQVARTATSEDLSTLLDYCGRAMVKATESAVEVWNLLSQRNLEPFSPLAPHEGRIVTNGDFKTPPIERGFDWHLAVADGVSVTTTAGAGINVELTGEQALAVTVLNEWVPVDPGRTYILEYSYTGGGDSSAPGGRDSGLAWQVEDPVTGGLITRAPELDSAAREATGSLRFNASGMTAAMLSLRYERAPGTVRHEEKFTIHRVSSRAP